MKLVHPVLPHAVEFDSNTPLVIRVEEARLFSEMMLGLIQQIEVGTEGDVVISDKDVLIKSCDIELIGDILSYDCNKKLSAKLIAQTADKCLYDEELNARYIKVRQELDTLLTMLIADSVLPLNFDNIDIAKLLKAANPKIAVDNDNAASKLCDIIKVAALTKSARVIALINSLCYFNEEDLSGIAQIASNFHMPLIFFEGYHADSIAKNAKNIIIDSDLCVIVI